METKKDRYMRWWITVCDFKMGGNKRKRQLKKALDACLKGDK